VKHILSKSSYIRSLQCLKSLYFYKFHYKDRDPISAEQQAKFDRGHQYGKIAHQLFPGGIDVSPPTPFEYATSAKQTQALLLKQQPVIYEAAFIANEVVVALDILVRKGGLLHAFEVKSTTAIHPTILNDAALQYFVITNAGYGLEDFSIIHLKPDYKDLPADDIGALFVTESVKEYCVSQQQFVEDNILSAKEIIRNKKMPVKEQGEHCNSPYPCDFKNICNKSNSYASGSLFG
jgi:hypothetical protein